MTKIILTAAAAAFVLSAAVVTPSFAHKNDLAMPKFSTALNEHGKKADKDGRDCNDADHTQGDSEGDCR